MKALIVASALVWSGLAYAQSTMPAPEGPPDTSAIPPSDNAMPPSTDPGTITPDPQAMPDAAAPSPANPPAAPMEESTMAPAASQPANDYPLCTRKIRDNCMNPGKK